MNTSSRLKLAALLATLVLAALACTAGTDAPAAPTSPAQAATARPAIPYQAVVQIWAMYYDESGQLQPGWTGSGSIITPDGFILTNAHVVLPDRYFPVDALIIAMTTSEDRPPEARYFAQVYQADVAMDIAVIRVIADLNNNPVTHSGLNLPYVPLGDPDSLRLGDLITIIGYPGIGGETVTVTRGEVSGFTSEAPYGDRAFIKTSATIAGGNSGGMAADSNGLLVGIPTQLGYGGDDQFVDCRVLADTNRDGQVDENDACVPTGGFINALRPINLALPLIAAARNGQINVQSAQPSVVTQPVSGSVVFTDDFSSVNSGWDRYTDSSGSTDYANGSYVISVFIDTYLFWANPGRDFGDVIVEVEATKFGGTSGVDKDDDNNYGVICRHQDVENFYVLVISSDGYYGIRKRFRGAGELAFIGLDGMGYSDVINQGNATNSIRAECIGNTIRLIVNGYLLLEVQDNDVRSGDVGLMAGTFSAGRVDVAFDNLVVSTP
ncbi:MAG: trypsin-like peptidase domain-containing protein [Chloroflexi bacterium]|nr:trypsin-like peptidase domain-containing protein [Chloroflexota bacterium]